jgi:hypothetical protein
MLDTLERRWESAAPSASKMEEPCIPFIVGRTILSFLACCRFWFKAKEWP